MKLVGAEGSHDETQTIVDDGDQDGYDVTNNGLLIARIIFRFIQLLLIKRKCRQQPKTYRKHHQRVHYSLRLTPFPGGPENAQIFPKNVEFCEFLGN